MTQNPIVLLLLKWYLFFLYLPSQNGFNMPQENTVPIKPSGASVLMQVGELRSPAHSGRHVMQRREPSTRGRQFYTEGPRKLELKKSLKRQRTDGSKVNAMVAV